MASAGQRESLNVQLLVDSIPALIHTARPDGYLDYFNKPWLEYLGVGLDKVAGWNWTAFVHPEDVEGIVAKWRGCLATGELFEYEARTRRANGEYRWMFHRKVPLRGASGNIVRWYGSSLDIEERKIAEEQLRRSAQELQRSEFYLAEGQRLAHLGSWAFGPEGFSYWSAELFALHGLDPAGKPPSLQDYLNCVHPHDRESMADLIKGILTKASAFDATKRIVRPGGEVRYIRCVGAPVVESQGPTRYVGSAMDVTQHELLTQELRRREAYLTEAQKLSHTGSFGWRPDTGEIVWSNETYRIFEYDPAEKPTLSVVLERTHPQDRALIEQVIASLSQGGTGFEHECRLLPPNGRVKHVHAIAHALQNADGNREIVGAVTDITERKTTEDKIRRMVEADVLGIFIANVQGEIVEANQAFLQMLQYSRQDLVSRRLRWTDLTPPELRERDERALTEAVEGGVFQPYEKEFFRKDGSRVPVLIGGALLQSADEGVVLVLDLSRQKRAEQALRISEAYLAEAQTLSKTGSFAWSPTADTTYFSRECYRVLGFEPQGALPPPLETIMQRIHPDDRGPCRELVERSIRDKVDLKVDYRIVHLDQRVRDIHCVGHVVLDRSGELSEIVGTVIDVTEQKAAEEKIREQESDLRQMLDLAPQHVTVFGSNGERFYANRIALEYVGLSIEGWRQASGSFFQADGFVHPDDWERAVHASVGPRSSGSAYELELRIRGADGSYRWFLVRCNPLRDERGQVKRWYVAATDIDDRKQAEDTLRRENVALREELDQTSMFEEIVGTSPALKVVLSRISKVAPSDSTVLVTGETGTGKELVARAIHRRSERSSRAFVSVSCAAVPRELIASELFGHEKGAFTGATQLRLGRFELANGGTLFLDEVGELPAETQIALLRVLQEHEFERVGGTRRIHADVRVIAATNRDLQAAISTGAFRRDLYYRLNVFPIEIPSLRERREDIPLLAEYFIDRYARKAGKSITTVDQKTLRSLESYPWPGNIRELQNVIERSVILSESTNFAIDESWLSRQSPGAEPTRRVDLSQELALQEKELIETALRETGGRVFGPSGAAAKLGMPRSTMESKIRSLKINKNRFKA